MEQARKREAPVSVADKMARLAERYPLDKYVWIMPKLETAGALPEHLDFMISTRKFSPDDKKGDVYPVQGGGLALAKRSLMALAADAGVKWIPNLNRRLDDGSNPDVVEWQATGILAGLSGMTPVTETKRIDLDLLRERDEWKLRNRPPREIWIKSQKKQWGSLTTDQRENYIRNKVTENDMQRKEFKVEMAETKAQLRVIRAILGIPSKFDAATIQNKEFAVLRIIFAPNAQTPEERKMIIEGMMSTYLGAYPGAEKAGQLGEGPPAAVAIQPHQVQGALPAAEPVDEASVTPEEIQAAEVVGNGEGGEGSKATTDNFAYLKTMGEIKRRFIELLGKEDGAAEYYKILGGFKAKHANEILEKKEQGRVYRALREKIELLEKNVKGESAEEEQKESDDEWIYKPIRSALGNLTKAVLAEKLAKAQLDYDYPIDEDPEGIKALLSESDTKENLIEAHVRIMKYDHKRKKEGGVSQ